MVHLAHLKTCQVQVELTSPGHQICSLVKLGCMWLQHGDVGTTPGFDGDHVKALASIKAKTLVLPAERDLYFPVADEEYEVSKMSNAELRVIPGIWGHFAGGGANPEDTQFIDNAVKELLSDHLHVSNVSKDFAQMHVSA